MAIEWTGQPMLHSHRAAARGVLALLLIAAATSACSDAAPGARTLRLDVTPRTALLDAPVAVTVHGARPGARVTLSTRSVDAHGAVWTSSAAFRADRSGTVSTARAPISGSYRGANPMGLFQDEVPVAGPAGAFAVPTPWTVTVTARTHDRDGASASVRRQTPVEVGVTRRPLAPAVDDGLVGEFEQPVAGTDPRHPAHRHTAVVTIGGSEGGVSTTPAAQLLAAHGYPTLALGYFHAAGLPATLTRIPLEYFARAVAWLARQPGVDPRRIVVWGVSRGSEAALLTGAYYPRRVAGVVATAPSDIAFGGIPDGRTAAWTQGGRDLPFATGADAFRRTSTDPAAMIPVARIRGPVFAACGRDDAVWGSCTHVRSLGSRLAAATHRPTLLAYPDAGHLVGSLVPDIPSTASTATDANGDQLTLGGTPAGDQAARAAAWPRLLDWLRALR